MAFPRSGELAKAVAQTLVDRRFGEELRRWRDQRRLSQLELAVIAGTTQRYLSYLERGRSLPGRGMVMRLAESLDLPLRERNALLVCAGYAPAYSESALDGSDLSAVQGALEAILVGYEPYPAIVIDRGGELVSNNTAAGLFFENVADHLLTPPVNTNRLALHPQGLAPRIANFAQWAPHVTESLRRELSRNPDPTLQDLLDELDSYLPTDAEPWSNGGFPVPMELITAHGVFRLITTLTTFATATAVILSEIRLEAFLPADETTANLLVARRDTLVS
jgi:transcriptional regulator with XRE-family HTH domain